MDFTQTPPGMLALDNMLYFAKHHQDAYIRVSMKSFSWCRFPTEFEFLTHRYGGITFRRVAPEFWLSPFSKINTKIKCNQ